VIERRQHLRLALESSHAIGILRERLGQDLDGNVAVELGVSGAPDLSHPALAELGGNAIVGD
jgi:hypothetical protein